MACTVTKAEAKQKQKQKECKIFELKFQHEQHSQSSNLSSKNEPSSSISTVHNTILNLNMTTLMSLYKTALV